MSFKKENDQFLKQEVSSEYKVLKSKEGLPIFEINGYITNSKYNPFMEAKRLSDQSFKKNYFHILVGIGSGVIAEELYFRLGDNEKMLIIEPNVEIYNKLSELTNSSFLLDDEKVTVITGLKFDDLEVFLSSIVGEYNNRIQVIISPNYEKIYPLFVKQTMQSIKESLILQLVNRTTLKMNHGLWQQNVINNLYHVNTSVPFINLLKKLDIPIVIASGGPSLIKQLKLIKENRNKMFLLCAGSTINTLLANGIRPDAVVSLDGGYENYKQFENLGDLNIPIFYHPIIHKEILNLYKGMKIVFNDRAEFQSTNLINSIFSCDLGDVSGGPSVANYCLDIAFQLTTGPVCLIGQDLAFTNNVSHAEGNKGFSVLDEKKIEERKMFYIEGYNGDNVLTDYPLFSMKKSFESYIENVPTFNERSRIYNCTEGGALIEGFTNIPFYTFINSYCKLDVSNRFETLLYKFKTNKTEAQWKELYNYIIEERVKSKKAIELCKEAIDILVSLNDVIPQLNLQTIHQLETIDLNLKEVLENEFLFYLFGEVAFNINNYFLENDTEIEQEKQKRIYLKSLALYEGLYASLKMALDWFEELLDKISNEI